MNQNYAEFEALEREIKAHEEELDSLIWETRFAEETLEKLYDELDMLEVD